jgi:hypothetical protein
MESEVGKKAADDEELVARYFAAGVRIETKAELAAFAKQRWPEQNPSDYRRSPGGPRSREAMAELWAHHLESREAPEKKSGVPKAVTA